MKKDGRQNGQHKQHAVRHVTGRGALGVLLCAAMFFTSTAFAIPSTAPGDERAQDGAVGGSRTQISRPDGDTSDGSPSQGSPAQGAGATGNTAAGASASAEESGAAALPGRKAAPQPVGEGETGAADAVLYTDRSGNVGVSKEGYTDAAANLEIHADSTLRPNLGENTTNEQERTGGTLFLELERYPLTSAAFKYYCNEQAWDGKAPFRVTGEGYNIVVEAVVNDFMLENNDTYGGVTKVPPAFSFKMDHLTYQSRLPSMNFWARGNKLVIGSGVTTNAHGIIGQDTVFKIYGGAEHQTVFTQEPKVLYPTNVVVESANWDEVFGGGKANTAYGTNVTVRGTANIAYLAGGGEDECQIAVYDQADGQGDESLKGVGANVYVEGGTVGTLFGGSRVTANALLQLLDQKALNVYTPVNITVSGGSVTKLFAMNDFTGFTGTSADDTEYIRGSSVHADATVNISGEGAAQYVVGDLYRNLPVNAENQRHVLGTTRANITASNTFQRLNYFDVVHISGTDVVVSANEVIGGSMTDNAVTAYGPDFDGYVGQIAVTNGATLLLNNRAVINNYYNNVALGDTHYQESDREIKANSYDDSYYLSHSWVGEYSEERRALSTVEINGQSVGITAASGTRLDEANAVCGLLIHGTVQGQLGSDSGYGKVPGYSTLKAAGTPIYSTANDYYYYIVADSSENGGKAFREPEGADYIVCYQVFKGLSAGLGAILDPVLQLLIGKNLGVRNMLDGLLDARKSDPASLATGAFAGRIIGKATVEDCEVENVSVTAVKTNYENKGKIVGQGGFVGHVEGETSYDVLSNTLGVVGNSLADILNAIPGLGLGDLVTVLLDNGLLLKKLIPTGYVIPEISRCAVNNGTLTSEAGKIGVGGFAGSVCGTVIRDSTVKNCANLDVFARELGGGFAGVTRDAFIKQTLSGLGINVARAMHPQSELIRCSIENSNINVHGGKFLGGFTGALANSYGINDTIDAQSNITVSASQDYAGGFTGSAMLGTLLGMSAYLVDENDLLGVVKGLLTGLLGQGADQSLLELGGVASSSVMGCQLLGNLTVSAQGSYAGGFLGRGNGVYLTASSEQELSELPKYKYGAELPINTRTTENTTSETRGNYAARLKNNTAQGQPAVAVYAGRDFAGGIAGYLTSANVGGLLGDTAGIGQFLGFTVSDTTVRGTDGGFSVETGHDFAGGGIG